MSLYRISVREVEAENGTKSCKGFINNEIKRFLKENGDRIVGKVKKDSEVSLSIVADIKEENLDSIYELVYSCEFLNSSIEKLEE